MESDQPPNVPRVRLVQTASSSSRGRGWFFFSLVLLILLGLTWLGILGGVGDDLALKGTSADGLWKETVVRDNASTNRVKVALIEADGIISSLSLSSSGGGMASSIKRQLQLAAEDENVEGVLLRIDSPGGEVLASDDIYREIERFQRETGKPVVASMSGLAASGGYYIAAPCRWIVANPLTITGSIGVILHSYNYRGLLDKVGVQPQVFKSGRFKDMLSGEKPPGEILPETREMFQAMIDEAFDRFQGSYPRRQIVGAKPKQRRRQGFVKGLGNLRRWQNFVGKASLRIRFCGRIGQLRQGKRANGGNSRRPRLLPHPISTASWTGRFSSAFRQCGFQPNRSGPWF